MRHFPLAIAFLLLAGCTKVQSAANASSSTPEQAAAALLSADRGYSARAANTDAISAVSAMLDDSALVANNAGGFAEGKTAIVELLRGLPLYTNARLQWTPVGGGISADDTHGFTFGYMTVRRPDSADVSLKYLAYWVKRSGGWRLLTINRRVRPAVAPSTAMLPPLLPPRMVAPGTDAARSAVYQRTMAEIEQAFSDYAQTAGLGPAFEHFGHAEAMNLGTANDAGFVLGPKAIAQTVGASSAGKPSPVSWSASKTFVASSGDLGINFGIIRQNTAGPGGAPPGRFPFFTVWHRKSLSEPWRYVAE